MSKSKAKGTAAETDIVNFLTMMKIRAVRKPLHGTKDEGDIDIYPIPITIEVKDHKAMKLSEWVDEAELEKENAGTRWAVVWHKRKWKSSPGKWYVTMEGMTFTEMLKHLDYRYLTRND